MPLFSACLRENSENWWFFPAAGQGQHLASCPGGVAARLRPALHAVQRSAASLLPRVLWARRLVHHHHDLLLLLQRILGQSLHVLRPQVSDARPTPPFGCFDARFCSFANPPSFPSAGRCRHTRRRQQEPSWPFSCPWVWPWVLRSRSPSGPWFKMLLFF